MVLLDGGKTSISHVALSKQYPHVHRGTLGAFGLVLVMFLVCGRKIQMLL